MSGRLCDSVTADSARCCAAAVAAAIQVRLPVDTRRCDDPHIKAQLLLQAHLGRLPPPISDYLTDTRGVLDNSVRLAQVRRLPGQHMPAWARGHCHCAAM